MTCGDPGRCDIMTGHCNAGCQVGWTGAMCEKGYHLTIKNTHENLHVLKTSCLSTMTCFYHIIISWMLIYCVWLKQKTFDGTESTNHTQHAIKPHKV